MNSARPIEDEASAPGTGAAIVSPGAFPVRQNTAAAEVLCRFLSGETLTGMSAVFDASTTRLAAHVGYLKTHYAWTFEHRDKANGCRDGRVAQVREYFLAPAVIERAMKDGACEWCLQVRLARAELRRSAGDAARRAAAENVRAKSSGANGGGAE